MMIYWLKWENLFFLLASIYLLIPPPYFPSQNHQFDVKYVLLFYYYGGMVYTCLHDYLKSLLFYTVVSSGKEKSDYDSGSTNVIDSLSLSQCLTVPTVAISAIMVAAYKKFILVSVLKFGKVSLGNGNIWSAKSSVMIHLYCRKLPFHAMPHILLKEHSRYCIENLVVLYRSCFIFYALCGTPAAFV